MGWHNCPMVALDFEATGTDPTEARIVTACLAHIQAGKKPRVQTWLIDPGVDIPAEATAVHGITTEQARNEGVGPVAVIGYIAEELVSNWAVGRPVIVMNAAYDLTLLDCELARHGLPSLADLCASVPTRPGGVAMLVIDPLVIDRKVDRYRRGKKRLDDLCGVYGVDPGEAHTADADALAAARIAWVMAEKFPQQIPAGLADLQAWQAAAHVEWAEHFEAYMREKVDPDCCIERDWPIRTPIPALVEEVTAP